MAEQLLPHVNDMDTSELTRGCLIGSQAQEDVFLARRCLVGLARRGCVHEEVLKPVFQSLREKREQMSPVDVMSCVYSVYVLNFWTPKFRRSLGFMLMQHVKAWRIPAARLRDVLPALHALGYWQRLPGALQRAVWHIAPEELRHQVPPAPRKPMDGQATEEQEVDGWKRFGLRKIKPGMLRRFQRRFQESTPEYFNRKHGLMSLDKNPYEARRKRREEEAFVESARQEAAQEEAEAKQQAPPTAVESFIRNFSEFWCEPRAGMRASSVTGQMAPPKHILEFFTSSDGTPALVRWLLPARAEPTVDRRRDGAKKLRDERRFSPTNGYTLVDVAFQEVGWWQPWTGNPSEDSTPRRLLQGDTGSPPLEPLAVSVHVAHRLTSNSWRSVGGRWTKSIRPARMELTEEQRQSLALFREVTADARDEAASIEVLKSCNWNVEQALSLHLASHEEDAPRPAAATASSSAALSQPLLPGPGHGRSSVATHGSTAGESPGSMAYGLFSRIAQGIKQIGFSVLSLVYTFFFGVGGGALGSSGAAFRRSLQSSYGTQALPEFHEGSFSQAVTRARQDLKLLVVYLHSRLALAERV
ncbi:unnamed protein product [Durusdinium trenchii]|uniref:Uncharacterized protein n=1 Tax=Durusdinium trenchii TaxID=1381693 RepID=A0ABP0Q5Q5_9DINO